MIARSAVVALALAGSAIVLGAAPRQDPKKNVVTDGMVAVGVACGDRTFVPVAARVGNRWKPLIEDEAGLDYFYGVLTPDARRLPRQGWTLYPPRARVPQPLSLKSPLKKGESSTCLGLDGFNSDAPRLPRRHVFPYRSSDWAPQFGGVGVLGSARADLGEDVTAQPDEASRRVAARVVREVPAVERRVGRETGDYSPLRDFAGSDIRSVVRLSSMVRVRINDDEWYFFQAHKQYNPYLDSGYWYAALSLNVHGWIRVASAGVSAFVMSGGFSDDGAWKGGRSYRLVGVLLLGDRTIWVTERSGWESTFYELFEVGPGERRPHSIVTVLVHSA